MRMIQHLIAAALVACRAVVGIPTIEIKGSKFFTSEGNQFFVKGIIYQSANATTNYLTDGAQCKIDAKLIAAMGANVVRVYSIDPTLSLDECMQAFADEGVYVICDMSTPTYRLDKDKPVWDIDLRNQFAKVLDGLHQYDNLLALFAGNEVIVEPETTIAAPAVKAVIADMKAYRDLMQYRKIPIGYSATDSRTSSTLQDYLDCGNDTIAADFFALNSYAWCGKSSYIQSGYDQLYARADGYDIPIFLSETGCNAASDARDFADQEALLGREMNDRYSGSIIYEWRNESNNYGIVQYSDDAAAGTPTLLPEYTSLKTRWSTLNPVGVKATAYDPTLTKRNCPESTASDWLVEASAGTEIPTLGLSGFTAPTTGQGTATATRRSGSTATGSSAATASGSSEDGSTKLSAGAIAGIVLGAVSVLLLLCAVLLFLRRKRKNKAKEEVVNHGEDAPFKGELDGTGRNLPRQPGYQEMPGVKDTQELGSAQAQYELRGYAQPGELPEQVEQHQPIYRSSNLEPEYPEHRPAPEPSPHVQAQRRREMEWLEMEETRMRQRREQLMMQGSQGAD
ncbi:Nn.00g028800.m01.CDS01 [Neocucurbitaria sp. VM-36]